MVPSSVVIVVYSLIELFFCQRHCDVHQDLRGQVIVMLKNVTEPRHRVDIKPRNGPRLLTRNPEERYVLIGNKKAMVSSQSVMPKILS